MARVVGSERGRQFVGVATSLTFSAPLSLYGSVVNDMAVWVLTLAIMFICAGIPLLRTSGFCRATNRTLRDLFFARIRSRCV